MGVDMVTRRQQRLNQLLRDEIDTLIRHKTDDPFLATMISVTDVEVTQDLQKAKIFVSTARPHAAAVGTHHLRESDSWRVQKR